MAHPIGGLMQTTLENMKEMVDVNTVIGEPIETSGGATVIPVSKVSFGFVAGGGEYDLKTLPGTEDMPFAGGSGAGVSVQPVGFLVVQDGGVSMLPAQYVTAWERAVNCAPQLVQDIRRILNANAQNDGQEGKMP
ncbi:MAG: GerW family sporulation protein [Clostridiales bacterium]|nr:GerW family sporulation protein [Clostridiales bacterium]